MSSPHAQDTHKPRRLAHTAAALLMALTWGCSDTAPSPGAASDMASDMARDMMPDMVSDMARPVDMPDTPADMPDQPDMLDMPASDMADMALDMASDMALEPLCTEGLATITCAHETLTLATGEEGDTDRDVHWQAPQGQPPAAGWPVVLMFQGATLPASWSWSGTQGAAYGMYNQTKTIAALLDAGFVVLTPEARVAGTTYWDTNVAPWSDDWTGAPDHFFMLDIFKAIDRGDFGAINARRMYATGISSGGYMTSRMAVSYPGKFRALAIQSGSYATCGGAFCSVPDLPADHPPTLFLHGSFDGVVPEWTMSLYASALEDQNTEVRRMVDAFAAHQWIDAAPDEVAAWFSAR